MVAARSKLAALAVMLVAGVVVLAGAIASRVDETPRKPAGVVTSLPIFWSPSADFGEVIADSTGEHWVRNALEQNYEPIPFDSVAADGEPDPSAEIRALTNLIVAQPRQFSPLEFVALDTWVRAGGRVLIFADPVLTEESDLPIGDPGRPSGAALLSPIFSKWGLSQSFDESQPEGAYAVPFGELAIPVEQAGFFEAAGNGDAQCSISAQGLVARCQVGAGRALIVADAHLLNSELGEPVQIDTLLALAKEAFAR